jgi:predicted adenine nucleotide alpha hydrolase (AANH) superfamily ATPase
LEGYNDSYGKFRFYTRTYDTRNTNLRKINTMETEGRKKKKCNKTFQQKFSISKESARGRFILVESFSGIIISATKNCKL